jgi:hypothetical protein
VGSDRAEAGQRLAAALEAIPRETPVFLIGHSHGGSVIVYFLKMYPMLASKIAGAAFLSTPFVAMRLRDYWNDIAKVLFSIVAAVVFVCSAAISSYLWQIVHLLEHSRELPFPIQSLATVINFVQHSHIIFRIPVQSILFYLLTWNIIGIIWRGYWSLSLKRLRARLRRSIRKQRTTDLPTGNHLFLRATGDEAAAVLSSAQALAWAINRVFHILCSWLGSVIRLAEAVYHYRWGKVLIFAWGLVVFCYIFFMHEFKIHPSFYNMAQPIYLAW